MFYHLMWAESVGFIQRALLIPLRRSSDSDLFEALGLWLLVLFVAIRGEERGLIQSQRFFPGFHGKNNRMLPFF